MHRIGASKMEIHNTSGVFCDINIAHTDIEMTMYLQNKMTLLKHISTFCANVIIFMVT